MRNKLLILTLVALTIIGVVIAQNQSLEEELASIEEELVNAGFDWLVNATIDENLDSSTIEVFTQNGNETLAVFEKINEEKFYKIYLTELNGTQDVFDLRINGSVEFDQILDPAPTMATVKINSTTNRSNESIKGYCKATDSDGDNLVYQYQWYNGSTVYFNGTLFKEGTISAGYYHTCGIRASDSRVLCWGDSEHGKLGDGQSSTDRTSPYLTTDSSAYLSVSARGAHTCGIRQSDRRVLCWGYSANGRLGDGQNGVDVLNPNLTTDSSAYSSVSAGGTDTCGIRKNDSRVLCWGNGDYGQLGDGSNATHNVLYPNVTTDNSSYSSISARQSHTCGIRQNDSRVLCWGQGQYGRLGDGSTSGHNVGNPNPTTDISPYISVSLGEYHTCGIRVNDSRVLCWGNGDYGQLGDGSTSAHSVSNPNVTTDSSSYSSMEVGYYHTCGIRVNDSRVLCWGNGTLGDGETTENLNPNVTTDNSSYSSISAGRLHTCGIRANDSRVLCWGESLYGRLGDGQSGVDVLNPNLTTDTSPYKKGFTQGEEVLVSILGNAYIKKGEIWKLGCRAYDFTTYSSWMNSTAMTILSSPPTMATVKINSTTNSSTENIKGYCNATDTDGDDLAYQYQWYNGSTVYFNGTLFKDGSISAGEFHTCGIRANDSRVLCWGDGDEGQLGDGSTAVHNNSNPNITTDSSAYSSVSAGSYHTCGIRQNDSRVLCWGRGNSGQLGDNGQIEKTNPTLTTDTSPYSSVSAGEDYTCGIRTNDSRVLCWGRSTEGQLGDGETTTRLVPTLTSDTSTYLRISAGEGTTCGIRANDSRVLCWGDGQYGSLGDGNTSLHNNLNPNLTTDTSAYSSVSVGGAHSCGIRANDSRVLCWGVGTYGRLGDGETTDNPNPNVTTDSFAYTKIIAGPFHTCGIRTNDSRVLCWGYGLYGQRGDGQTSNNQANPNVTTDSSAYANIELGRRHSCGIRANDSRVLCWGDGSYGTLGDGNTAAHNVANPNITTSSSPYKKGFSSSEEVLVSILGNAYLNVGENWSLGCRSYDFTDYSSWMNSSVLTIVPYEPSSGTGFFITNNAGGNVALFDKNGNFYLKGKKNSNQGTLNAPANSFVLQNSSGTTIAYVNSTGSLFARGSISEDSSLTGKTSSNLEFKNSTDNLIGFFDNQGNLKLKGYVVENYFSYILGLFNKMGLFFNQGLLHER